jgi:hypothetical protein
MSIECLLAHRDGFEGGCIAQAGDDDKSPT